MKAAEIPSGSTINYEGQQVIVSSVEDNGNGVTLFFKEEVILPSGTGVVAWKLAYDDEVEIASP